MNLFAQLRDKITKYLAVEVNLVKLGFIEQTAKVLSYLIFSLIALFIVFCIVLFLGFGLKEVFVLAGLSDAMSFFLTTCIYLVLFVIVVALRKNITRFFAGEIVNVMTEGNDGSDKDEAEKI